MTGIKAFWELCKQRFNDNVNWCHDYYDGTDKPENKLYSFLFKHWLFPFYGIECKCCYTTRGVFYGLIVGAVLGVKGLIGLAFILAVLTILLMFRSDKR